jgi:DNA-directed RNA polymerase specialized sigma24 family protein
VKINHDVAKEDFDKLLSWLSPDRDAAGERFEALRRGLIRYFGLKGCHEPDLLVDESVYRVAKRINELDLSKKVAPSTLFYGFANKVFLEYLRSDKKNVLQMSETFEYRASREHEIADDRRLECLDKCLKILKPLENELVVRYYSAEKNMIEMRRRIALQHNMTVGSLHTKVHRIKEKLRPCIDRCMKAAM